MKPCNIILKCDWKVYDDEVEELIDALRGLLNTFNGGKYSNFYIFPEELKDV